MCTLQLFHLEEVMLIGTLHTLAEITFTISFFFFFLFGYLNISIPVILNIFSGGLCLQDLLNKGKFTFVLQ